MTASERSPASATLLAAAAAAGSAHAAPGQVLAIPLWINGHPYLTMAPAFLDVCDARSGEVKRRTPLCGVIETRAAVDAARLALTAWSAKAIAERGALLGALGDALASYGGHFAGLIREEAGSEPAHAAAEVGSAISLLHAAASAQANGAAGVAGVAAIIADASAPLLGPLRCAVPALLAGATIVIKPSARAPSAAFALAELSARCSFPGGVCNILHGDEVAVECLCACAEVRTLLVAGDAALRARVAAIAERHGKPLAR